ncbi:DUF2121 family protein [Methanopyrus sp. KOL6]|uniref:DUF2121 family protein n=1 Tax=Methanopyrus sp. KOL6 TaxID=1937004 RepID=UPI000B4C1600|nr:DUF2121 family protein [Methanopyrus sp. KOL6]
MTLVLAYAGTDGALVAGDHRILVARMDEEKMREVEEKLYSGEIRTEEELESFLKDLEVEGGYFEFHDDRKKVWKVNDEVVAGEVGVRSAKGVRRRRVYATPGAHAIIELEGEKVLSKNFGGPALIVEGPKVVKELVIEFVDSELGGKPDLESLRNALDDIFEYVSSNTVLVSSEYDAFEVKGRVDHLARIHLQKAIDEDIERLRKYRRRLVEEMLKHIREGYDILKEGVVGEVVEVGTEEEGEGVEDVPPERRIVVRLVEDVDARHMGDVVAGPGEEIVMAVEGDPEKVEPGDTVVVKDGIMKIDGKDLPVVTGYSICRTRR